MEQKPFEITIIEKPSCYRKNQSGWYIDFGENKPGNANYLEHHEYRCHGDALVAAGIALNMLDKQKDDSHPSIEVSHFDFYIRAVQCLTDSPNKW